MPWVRIISGLGASLSWQLLCLIVLFTLPSLARAATGFYMNGVCYPTTAAIVEAFDSKYPQLDPAINSMAFITYATTVSATGVLTYRIDTQLLTSATVVTGTVSTEQLMNCTVGILTGTTEGLLSQEIINTASSVTAQTAIQSSAASLVAQASNFTAAAASAVAGVGASPCVTTKTCSSNDVVQSNINSQDLLIYLAAIFTMIFGLKLSINQRFLK
jgi:hypothetical protein